MKRGPKPYSLSKKFSSKYIPEPNTGCWIWVGATEKSGYGVIAICNTKKFIKAHRASYILFKGEIPKGLLICHKCNNKWCVNPDHLYAGTHKDNMHDSIKAGTFNFLKGGSEKRTHCYKGHEFNQKNIRIRKSGLRDCRICAKEYTKNYKIKNKDRLNEIRRKNRKISKLKESSEEFHLTQDHNLS